MNINRIAKRAMVILLTIVIFYGCFAPHAVNSETASYGQDSNTGQAINTISNNSFVNGNVLPDFSDLSDSEALAEAENAYRERMQRERAEAILTDSKISDYVNTEEFFETKPMFRLEALEKLNTYVVQNADNTNTVYIMSENVKYVDETGKIREKDINLSVTEKGYSVTDSDVKLQFPTKLSNGISVNTDFGSLSLVPRLRAENTAEFNEKANYVVYRAAFGTGSSLRYTPTLSGVKEDIILETCPETNVFEFTLETQGLYLYMENGIYYFVFSDNKDNRIRFGQIFIYDANGRFTSGEMTVFDEGSGTFALTMTVPREFLESPDTVYPVVVDPEIKVETDENSSFIIDAPVFQLQSNLNAGTWQYDSIGYTDSTYGLARTVVKLSGLLSNPTYQNLTSSKITNVTFSAKEATGNSSKTVKLHPITGNPTWTETSVTWNNYGSFDTSVDYGGTLTGGQWTHFNITNLVKAWKNGTYDGNGCFIFIMGGTESTECRALLATEYSVTASRPYVTLSYQANVTLSTYSIYVNEGAVALPVCTVSPAGTYIYEWSISNTSIATCTGANYFATMLTGLRAGMTELNVTVKDLSNETVGSQSAFVCVLIPDGIFKIENNSYNKLLTVEKTLSNQQLSAFLYAGSYSDEDPLTDQITQMWRIKHVVYNIYSIRPYYKLDMRLGKGGNNTAITSYIDAGDTYNSEYSDYMWWITWDSSENYVIRCDGTTKVLTAGDGQDLVVPVNVQTDSNLGLYARWYFINVTSTAPTGVYLYDADTGMFNSGPIKYIAPEENRSIGEFNLYPVAYSPNSIQQTFFWYSNLSTNATVSGSGTVTGISPGSAQLTGSIIISGITYTVSFTVSVTQIPNGVYFIKNKRTAKYADIEGPYMTAGTQIHQWEFNGNNSQRWIFTHLGNGYYSIKSANSVSDYYMGVQNDGTATDTPIVLRTGTLTDGMKWKVSVTTSGAYKITPKTGEPNNRVLAVGFYISNNNGIDIQQRDYVNDGNYKDEWEIYIDTPWSSNADGIGHWIHSPALWFSNLCTESSLPLLDGFTNGQYIWNEALNISVSLESSYSSADIKYYGGTKDQIDALVLFDPVATDILGNTRYDSYTYKTKIPSNTGEKNLFVINKISGYIVKRDDMVYYNYIKTIAHEMGHALGWFGHPAVSHYDWIMEQGRYTTSTLSDEERQHLKRAY